MSLACLDRRNNNGVPSPQVLKNGANIEEND